MQKKTNENAKSTIINSFFGKSKVTLAISWVRKNIKTLKELVFIELSKLNDKYALKSRVIPQLEQSIP